VSSIDNASASVFISYRRDDAGVATRLYDRLVNSLGYVRVFMDVETISPGQDFRQSIQAVISNATVVLAIIGPTWLDARGSTGDRRLSDPNDHVRVEIATALQGGIRVVPILVNDAFMPSRRELPADIASLASTNALAVRHETFAVDVEFLLDAIRRLTPGKDANGQVADIEPRARLTVVGEGLRADAVEFFNSSGRTINATIDRRLLGPEPILIVDSTSLTEQDIKDIGTAARKQSRLYLVHPGQLREAAVYELDKLRAHGTAIVPLSSNTIAAAVADGRTRAVLLELERQYGSGRNLFETKNSVIDERFLFGRSELLTRLGVSIASAESVLLTGLRKAGKTSVLNILRQHLVDYPVCQVDLQRFGRSDAEWPQLLFEVILRAYDRWGNAHCPGWRFGGAYSGDVFAAMERRRDYQMQHGESTPFVLLLDELERVLPLRGESDAAAHYARASGLIRALTQSYPGWIVVIAADLRPAANRMNVLPSGETNPMFQFFEEVPLRLLGAEAVDVMIRSLCNAMGVWDVDRRLSRSVFGLSGGHPALVRIIAGASFRSRKDPHRFRSSDLPIGLRLLAESNLLGSFFAENFWGPMTESEKQIMARTSTKGRSWMSRWHSAGDPVGNEREAEARAALVGQGLLHGDSVAVGAFVDWVRARSS